MDVYSDPRDDNPKVILITLLCVLLVAGIAAAFYFLGKRSSGASSSSISIGYSSVVSLPSTSSSSFATSSSSSVISSSSSSASSSPANTTYTDTDYTNVKFSYDASWSLATDNFPSPNFKKKSIVLTKNGNGSKLTIILNNAGQGVEGFCLAGDQIVDIGGGWSRVRIDSARYFNKTSSFNRTAPFTKPVVGGGDCPAGTVATGQKLIDIPDTAITQAYIEEIKLDLVGEDRTIADAIVKSLTY